MEQRSVQSDTKRGSRSRQRRHDNFGFRAVVGTAVARPVHNHHLLLLAAAKCNCGVTLASYHTMLHHRKRGFAILSTEWARRAKSRVRLAQTHPQEGETARGTETLATARGDVAFVLAAREIAQGCFAPLPAARHVALTFNEDARCAFPSCVDCLLRVVNARMDKLRRALSQRPYLS